MVKLVVRPTLLLASLVALGCNGQTDGSADSGANDAPTDTSTTLTGTWVGYIEGFQFMDGSSAATMTLVQSAAVTGTVYFGVGQPLAPPTDPTLGYPPSGLDAREGFAFAALNVTYVAPHLTLQIQASQIWKQWCELQTTIYPDYNGESDGGCGNLLGYNCLPNVAFEEGTFCAWSSCDHPLWSNIDCGKLALCGSSGPCQCTATSCTVPVATVGGIAFDMQLGATALDGTVTGLDAQAHNVHLTRQ